MPGLARGFQARRGVFWQRSERLGTEVIDPYVAGQDGIAPSHSGVSENKEISGESGFQTAGGRTLFFLPNTSARNFRQPLTSLPPYSSALSTFSLNVTIDREHQNPFADLHVNVGEEREGFRAGDFAHLLAKFFATLLNQNLP